MKCRVCGKEYSKKDIQPAQFYDKDSKKWLDIDKVKYKGKICHFVIYIYIFFSNTLMQEHYLIDLKH